MDRVAVFVDAGYLLAAGAKAISGRKLLRKELSLHVPAAVTSIFRIAATVTGLPVLRIYWYDGAMRKGPTAEHLALGHTDNVKLRLGMLNSAGEQKEVDSLIITDLIELARNRAISDAVLVSGDADTRIGVEVAQTFGVRVHLIGVAPKRESQSLDLLQSADTTHEMDAAFLSGFLFVNPPASRDITVAAPTAVAPQAEAISADRAAPGGARQIPISEPFPEAILQRVVDELLASLAPTEKENLKSALVTGVSVPHEYDGRLLAKSRTILRRELSLEERKTVRAAFLSAVRSLP